MQYKLKYIVFIAISFSIVFPNYSSAQTLYSIQAEGISSIGENAPFWLVNNRQGLSSIENNNGYLRTGVFQPVSTRKSFDLGYGLDLVGAVNHVSDLVVHQVYLDVKLNKCQLSIGSKETPAILKNNQLSSGGMSWSGNAAPVPQVSLVVPEYVSFPWLMKGRLKLKGDLSYGRFADGKYQKENSEFFNGNVNRFYNTRVNFHHKSFVATYDFRNSPWSITLGLEEDVQFGGIKYSYNNDSMKVMAEKYPVGMKDYLKALIPSQGDGQSAFGDRQYMYGNTLGSEHFVISYRRPDYQIRGYLENYFDDFSGMAKENGFDGLWGLEYSSQDKVLTGIVLEYLQTTDQSGPIHWAPNDFQTNQKKAATGNDDYYNNYFYTGWANYGMACGNPLLTSPVYNKDGVLRFENNRVKAFHSGVSITIGKEWSARVLATYSRNWGRHYLPFVKVKDDFSSLCEVVYAPRRWAGWKATLSLAGDMGNMYGDNFGGCVKVSRQGVLSCLKNKK